MDGSRRYRQGFNLCTLWKAIWVSMFVSFFKNSFKTASVFVCRRIWYNLCYIFKNQIVLHARVCWSKNDLYVCLIFASNSLRVISCSRILVWKCLISSSLDSFNFCWSVIDRLSWDISFSTTLNRCSICCSLSTILSSKFNVVNLFWISLRMSPKFGKSGWPSVNICGVCPWPCPLFPSNCGVFICIVL